MQSDRSALNDGGRPPKVILLKKSDASEGRVKVAGPSSRCNMDKSLTTLGAGILLITVAVILHLSWDELISSAIQKEFILTETSKSHDLWVRNLIPLYINFYFFNWTNPSDLKSPSNKPEFEEVGPYTFREEMEKTDIAWNENGTVTYKKRRKWYFVPEASKGTLNDSITTLNVVALAAAHSTRNWISIAKAPVSLGLSRTQKIHVTKTAGELLFDGYEDPLIKLAKSIPGLSSQVPFDRFGWFYQRNGSTDFDGVFNIETGSNGMEHFGKITTWNYSNSTSYYPGHCSDVKGSAGEFWPPKRTKTEDIYMFTPDMCRYIGFKYRVETSVKGLTGYRYDPGSNLFDNGTADPSNECFCGGECVPSGTVNVSSCRFGTPGFISYPHFYLADPYYRDAVGGMKPDPEKHEMYIVLEPNLGVPLEVAARLQINILLRPDPDIGMYQGVPKLFFPMIWFEQKVTIPDEMVFSTKLLLALPLLGLVSYALLYAVGFTFIFIYGSRKCTTNARYTFNRISRRPKANDNSFRKKMLRMSRD